MGSPPITEQYIDFIVIMALTYTKNVNKDSSTIYYNPGEIQFCSAWSLRLYPHASINSLMCDEVALDKNTILPPHHGLMYFISYKYEIEVIHSASIYIYIFIWRQTNSNLSMSFKTCLHFECVMHIVYVLCVVFLPFPH